MKTKITLALMALIALTGCKQTAVSPVASPKGTAVFDTTMVNIASNYECPDWYRDAKLGIFIHWGVYSVPAYESEWYSRNMYQKDSNPYKYHREVWGDQQEFGYKDFIPLFKAEKFDAKEWAELLRESGAKYVVPVAEHHDGFAMYDSDLNPWNAVKMGPKRDVICELKEAIEAEGLVFGASSHRLENAWFFNGGMEFPSDVQDTTLTIYGKRDEWEHYDSEWGKDWLAHTREIIDKYQPKLMYFDWTVNNDSIRPFFAQFLAYYYNNALDWGEGVVVNTKQGYSTDVMVWDMERGKTDRLMVKPWQTCTSIGKHSWGYVDGEENKTPQQIIHDLVDIVSKNGNMLLNIGPRPDGTITEEQTQVLLAIGDWLSVNGEAIYGTRPWKRFGEGPTVAAKGTFTDYEATPYTSEDIRFTTKGNDFYAIVLDWDDEILIKSLNKTNVGDAQVNDVKLLGSDDSLEWAITDDGMRVKMPKEAPCQHAYAIKISFSQPVGQNLESEASNEVMKHG